MMKQRFAVLLMVLGLSGVCFAQSVAENPETVIREFWKYALENNLEKAKQLIAKRALTGESIIAISERIRLIAVNEVKIKEITRQAIFEDSGFVLLGLTDKANKYLEAQILLKKEKNQWLITFIYLRDVTNLPLPIKPQTPIWELIKPGFPKDYPIKKDCPKCT